GRGEQTVRPDQANGLLISGPVAEEDLIAFRKLFTSALERLGFPPCPGNIMVRNPIWSMPVEDFIRQIKGWVIAPDENTPMYLAILADAIAVGRNPELLSRAKEALFDVLRGEKIHLAHFAKAVDMFSGSGGMLNALMASVGREDSINLKKAGIFPIVHGIRSYAIEKGVRETGTLARIDELAGMGALEADMAKELAGAFRFLMELRLRSQLAAVKHGNPEAEADIKPSELTTLERDLLRDALRVVKEFRELVRAHFNLRMF
ncbi:MAG TPA: putative nucleotidyltransferase substrate binding domain-containing protein, partial [Aestuariivirga sp.]|nr:putative nucleotidyltransferase substrate binding domain-containing protein [Aestuariivirga sp.]